MNRKKWVALILIALYVLMFFDLKINNVDIMANFFKQFETESIRELSNLHLDDNNLQFINRQDYPSVEKNNKLELNTHDLQKLKLNNSYGSITVQGSNSDQLEINYEIIVYANSEASAAEYLKEIEINPLRGNGDLLIETVKPKTRNDIRAVEINYQIIAPKWLALDLQNKYGKLSLHNLAAMINAENKYGLSELNNIAAPINFTGKYGDLTISNIQGDLNFTTDYIVLNISDVTGLITGEANYGDLTFKNIQNSIELDLNYCDLDLRLDQTMQDVKFDLKTKYGNIITDFALSEEESNFTESRIGQIGAGKYLIEVDANYSDLEIR